jgi:hypothetical protein
MTKPLFPNEISFVTAHFHDFQWTELLLRRIRATTPVDAIREIIVIDQDRTAESRKRLLALDPLLRVLQYPREERLFQVLGHDHPAVLNQIMAQVRGDWICLFDSDAHPTKTGWLSDCAALLNSYDAILAEDPRRPGMSHPCFMLFQRRHAAAPLLFDEGLLEMPSLPGRVAEKNDTGRMIRRQLVDAGQRVYLAAPTRAFDGQWGDVYLGCIYHHGSGSFKGGDDLLARQVTWRHEFFENWVLNQRGYKLIGKERVAYQIKTFIWNLRNKVVTALRLLRGSTQKLANPT